MNNEFEILDVLTILSFITQINQIQNSDEHMQIIETKLNFIINKLEQLERIINDRL